MCCRYYIDDDTIEESMRLLRLQAHIVGRLGVQEENTNWNATYKRTEGEQKVVRVRIDGKVRDRAESVHQKGSVYASYMAHDIHPNDMAPVILSNQGMLTVDDLQWGFPQHTGKGLLINARAESALQKPSFSESMLYRRCIIPARHFYEWDPQKNKVTFRRSDTAVLFMAGCYNLFPDGRRFTILTTRANASMEPVHDRMPLILEPDEVAEWFASTERARILLQQVPVQLERTQEYEQQSLFDL